MRTKGQRSRRKGACWSGTGRAGDFKEPLKADDER